MNELDRHDPMGCPDAEMLAAWAEGGLYPDERARVEGHSAACGRCQARLAAIARTATAMPNEVPHGKRLRLWPWLVPAAGAAAAVTVWVIVQGPQPSSVPEPRPQQTEAQARDEADKPAAAPAPVEEERLESRQAASPRANRAPERKLDALAKERRDRNAASEAPAAVAPAAPPPASPHETTPMSAARAADASAASDLVVHRSPEGRVTWEAQREGIYTQLTAGSSPSPSVIWLVGKGGLVLLSTDSRSWRRLPFPEPVDLTGVEASSDTTATVTSADARVFTTSDGGASWQRK